MPDGMGVELRATIYPTLWQPIMIKGVPRDWGLFCVVAAGFSMMVAGWIGFRWFAFVGIGVFGLLILVGWLAAQFDPEFFSIFTTMLFKIGSTRGRYKGNYYVA